MNRAAGSRCFVYGVILICISCKVIGNPLTNCSKPLTFPDCGKRVLFKGSEYPRIVSGSSAKRGQFPWMVSLQEEVEEYGFMHVCGGSILNDNWIVTAAHCIDYVDAPEKYKAVVGLHFQSRQHHSAVLKLGISEMILHEDYGKNNENDIALLRTDRPIPISSSNGYIDAICLPSSDGDPSGYATVIGWGYHMLDADEITDALKWVNVPIVSRSSCNRMYAEDNVSVLNTMICAGARNRDACQSDSGGPLFQTNRKGVSTLIGIVSHGTGCGHRRFPGVYTKVGSYLSWIASKLCK